MVPSTECAIDTDNTGPAFFEIEFMGLDEQGEGCSAGIAVTPEMVAEVPLDPPIPPTFTIEVTDDAGAEWLIVGDFRGPGIYVEGSARQTDGDTYCETDWLAGEVCVF